jgi:RNA-directed DNA polymerase
LNLKLSHSPTGEDMQQRDNGNPALNDHLLQQVLESTNIQAAWKQVRRNKGAAGIDGITILQFPEWIRPQWQTLEGKLRSDHYRPQPVKRVRIPKDDGSERLLGIPTVLDRVLQQSIVQVLSPLLDPTFSEHSHGFRPNRSAHDAVKQISQYCQQQRKIAVDIDLSKFFDRVNHDLLMTLLGRRIADKGLLQLIGRFLRCGIMDDDTLIPSRAGVPQGGPLSPLSYPILCSMSWIKNWKNGVTVLPAMPMT